MLKRISLSFLVLCSFTGCTNLTKVEPWQKGNLAKPHMVFEADPLDTGYTEHTYFSKEGASGGGAVGGGGCGCN